MLFCGINISLFGKEEKVIWIDEFCQEEICNPDEGPPKIKCGKQLVIINGVKKCSFNELHNIKGPPK